MFSKIKNKITRKASKVDDTAVNEYEIQKDNFNKWFSEEYNSAKDIMKFFKIFWFGLDKTYTYQGFQDVVELISEKSFCSIDTFNELEDLVDQLGSNFI